jgi:hypothetical protein
MKKTLSNLEACERKIENAFHQGQQLGHTMEMELNNIRKHRLYEALPDPPKNFIEYCKLERFGGLPAATAQEKARIGEVHNYLPAAGVVSKYGAPCFSGAACLELGKLRVVDKSTGKKTHTMDQKKIQRVANVKKRFCGYAE